MLSIVQSTEWEMPTLKIYFWKISSDIFFLFPVRSHPRRHSSQAQPRWGPGRSKQKASTISKSNKQHYQQDLPKGVKTNIAAADTAAIEDLHGGEHNLPSGPHTPPQR